MAESAGLWVPWTAIFVSLSLFAEPTVCQINAHTLLRTVEARSRALAGPLRPKPQLFTLLAPTNYFPKPAFSNPSALSPLTELGTSVARTVLSAISCSVLPAGLAVASCGANMNTNLERKVSEGPTMSVLWNVRLAFLGGPFCVRLGDAHTLICQSCQDLLEARANSLLIWV